jgi:RHS repeat-associated protein
MRKQSAGSYAYNGLGDRISQTVGSTTTNYTLDLAAGLSQVLADGMNTHLYGLGRIGEQQPAGWQYHLDDALGSVRQLVDASGEVQLSDKYKPYGEVMESIGEGTSIYGFAGEISDSDGLIFLRARYYDPMQGRFLQRDPWQGGYTKPASYNARLYGYANPVRYVDPTGKSSEVDPYDLLYGIRIEGSWSSENKEFVRTAVVLVANKFANTLGTSMAGLPSNNPQALIFMAVYGIHRGDTLKFDWNPQCYRCRPDACMAENNVGGKKSGGVEHWEDDVDVPLPNGTTSQCDCKPTGGFTMSARWIKFASMWSKTYSNVDERRVNNVVHELGHAFSARVGGPPATTVHTSPPPIEGDSWTLEQKPKGFYNAATGNMTWMQSKVESGSETYADMFLGWVFNKWEPDKYGNARAGFMNMNMLGWIRQAINLP